MGIDQKLTKKALLEKLKLLDLQDEETEKSVVCALVGHSNIEHLCMGEHSCARCGDVVGDGYLGSYVNEDMVVMGHNCKICRKNFKKLTWRDKFMAPDPFTDK